MIIDKTYQPTPGCLCAGAECYGANGRPCLGFAKPINHEGECFNAAHSN